ncbi:hypothetical protein BG006_009698 [Podila minutissima]|uniref:Uncharacterized protein n=1 Tax=Podila minutissima TaxID=64525 RepID=A0A9P5SRK3_9FUNG|nr:hypothetical protein BG006_009698 [Podila minutissima]
MVPPSPPLHPLPTEFDTETVNAFIKAAAENPDLMSSSVASTITALQNSLNAALEQSALSASAAAIASQPSTPVPTLPNPTIISMATTISDSVPTPVSVSIPVSVTIPAPVSVVPVLSPAPVLPAPAIPTAAPAPAPKPAPKREETSRPFVSTKKFNPEDIFCLGCCRNLTVDHYTCPNTGKVFKSCNACRQKSRINSKKIVKPVVIPVYNTISMAEFTAKLKEMEATQDETNLDVRVREEGPREMDVETLKARGAAIAQEVYEATGYWFSHSRTNDETQSKTRLKIYACSQRADRRAPPAPKTQVRKRNRPSTKAYFPCKGNLTMTFYKDLDHVRIVYGHKRHDKYDNRKCPDHVRAFVKENLNLPPRQLFETVNANNPGITITQAQVRYWSHFYKKNAGQDPDSNDVSMGEQSDSHSNSEGVSPAPHLHHHDPQQQQQHLDEQAQQQRQEEQVDQVTRMLLEAEEQLQKAQRQSASDLSGSAIAISIPMSGEMDTSPLTSSIVQRVLANASVNATDSLLHLPGLGHHHHHHHHGVNMDGSDISEGDVVVQQVSAFIQENEQLLEHQRQLELQQQQQQQQQQQS